jgi:AraC-like DNA-binding protein
MDDARFGPGSAGSVRCDARAAWSQPPASVCAGDELRIDVSPCERVLRKTGNVALGRHSCAPSHPLFVGGAGPHSCTYIAFHRSSLRMRIGEWRSEVVTPINVTFHQFGQRFSRESIGNEGDECDWIAMPPAMARMVWPGASETVFPRPIAPIPAHLFLRQRGLFARAIAQSGDQDDAALEADVIELTRAVVSSAGTYWSAVARKRRRPKPICLRRRFQIVEAAKSLLAAEPCAGFSVTELAYRLHCSVAHLSRTFHASTGLRITDYRQELRLRKGLLLLEEGGLEIGHIANRLGFASHSHFTDAFRRRFLMNPSEYIRSKSAVALRAGARGVGRAPAVA